jgi:hypothetical protein
MSQHTFRIEIELFDYRNHPTLEEDNKVMAYRAYLSCDDQHCAIWSQPLNEDEIGTPESYWNIMDSIRYKMMKKLCDVDGGTTYPPLTTQP